jgi:hypothetical protein
MYAIKFIGIGQITREWKRRLWATLAACLDSQVGRLQFRTLQTAINRTQSMISQHYALGGCTAEAEQGPAQTTGFGLKQTNNIRATGAFIDKAEQLYLKLNLV